MLKYEKMRLRLSSVVHFIFIINIEIHSCYNAYLTFSLSYLWQNSLGSDISINSSGLSLKYWKKYKRTQYILTYSITEFEIKVLGWLGLKVISFRLIELWNSVLIIISILLVNVKSYNILFTHSVHFNVCGILITTL